MEFYLQDKTTEELQALRQEIDSELARRRLDQDNAKLHHVSLLARQRDLNAKGRGTEEFRKIAFPDGQGGYHRAQWVSDVGMVTHDDWCQRGIRAAERRCSTHVEVDELPVGPEGALVITIDKPVGNGSTRASVHAGFLPTEPREKGKSLKPLWDSESGIESVGTIKEGEEFWTKIRFTDGRVVKV